MSRRPARAGVCTVTGWLFALGSALLYGVSDFIGGLASRRAHFVGVALVGQLTGLVVAAAASLLVIAPSPGAADLSWGALSGIGTAAGMAFLFRGISHGKMSVVVPTSAVTGVSLPVLAGVAIGNERPSVLAWSGILVALPALWLVSRDSPGPGSASGSSGVGDGLLAGVGIAVQYLALSEASELSGLWPVTAGRVSAVGVLLVLAVVVAKGGATAQRDRQIIPLPPGSRALAAGAGATAAAALAAYLVATRHELTVIAVVLSSLYPVIPVLLGITVLGEQLTRRQTAGLVAAGAATALLAA